MTTNIYFVRHAQPDHSWQDDRSRPLTEAGKNDCRTVLDLFKTLPIERFYCSPYRRSLDTIAETADSFHKTIIVDERLRERECGQEGNNQTMFQKRWADKDFHEEGGESIHMVQRRNIEVLNEILLNDRERTVVIGTHGTALSSILNYYNPEFNCDSFLKIIDWMPYILELVFQGNRLVKQIDRFYVKKDYKQ